MTPTNPMTGDFFRYLLTDILVGDHNTDDDRRLAAAAATGNAYRHIPGPPIDEQRWLRDGVIVTETAAR